MGPPARSPRGAGRPCGCAYPVSGISSPGQGPACPGDQRRRNSQMPKKCPTCDSVYPDAAPKCDCGSELAPLALPLEPAGEPAGKGTPGSGRAGRGGAARWVQGRLTEVLLVFLVGAAVLVAVGKLEVRFREGGEPAPEGPNGAPEVAGRYQVEPLSEFNHTLRDLDLEGCAYRYSGGFLDCWLEVESAGQKKTYRPIHRSN